jgi:hypothetical protein
MNIDKLGVLTPIQDSNNVVQYFLNFYIFESNICQCQYPDTLWCEVEVLVEIEQIHSYSDENEDSRPIPQFHTKE